MFVEVIPEAKSYKSEFFTYSISEEFIPETKIGAIVQVPFGKKKIRGLVKKIKENETTKNCTSKYAIKNITRVETHIAMPEMYIHVMAWLANRYFCTLGEALSLFLPPEMKRPPKPKSSAIPVKSYGSLKKLSDVQASIYHEINDIGPSKPHLIYGVTGSGKTEIYLHLAADAIKAGKSVVVLVPEIILTPQTVDRFREVFGDDIALLHSNLSVGEKFLAYKNFNNGDKKVIIGPRSALLVPNDNIGLIIIDEEHEEAYKQDNSPRYHAVDLAEQIACQSNATLILGSATPRIESYYKAHTGQYILHQIMNRYNKLLLPPSESVDLRNELRSGNFSILSEKLSVAIKEILQKKKQAILFLNRRGSSTFVSCRECGFVVKCPNCDIPLIHHSVGGSYLYCHHCDLKTELPSVCPECHGVKIKYFGAGVEKVESEVKAMFPTARVRRIDATTIKNKGDYETFYRDFKARKFDIAIGTQMITKGLDLPHVDLVGIISADTGLHMPYFRASEKVFRLVTQVSGRSGRGDHPGKTIIQTYWPDSSAIQFAANHDFDGFYDLEIKARQKLFYPPFKELIRVVSEHENPTKAKNNLVDLALQLDKLIEKYPDQIDYIGPGLCFFQRVRNKWRYHIIIKLTASNGCHPELISGPATEKDENSSSCHSGLDPESQNHVSSDENTVLMNELRELWKDNLNLTWDVDPFDLL